MKVAPHSFGVSGEQVSLSRLHARILHHRFHICVDGLELVKAVDIGNVSRVKDVVDVLKEGFTLDLNGHGKSIVMISRNV